MKLNLKLSVFALCTSLSLSLSLAAQQQINGRGCATPLPPKGWDEAFNKDVEEHKQNLVTGKTQAAAYTIPVVVHIIYSDQVALQVAGGYPNLSAAQINSQIQILNNDYAGNGHNVGNLAGTPFASLGAANCGVSFCLAQLDPDGDMMTEAGIDRVSYTNIGTGVNPNTFSSQNSFENYVDNTLKPATIWDPKRYFNIWVSDISSSAGLLGFSTFPASSTLLGLVGNNSTPTNDGIWISARAFGNIGTLEQKYNLGRTATHETGHYLGLRHIGGDGQANGTGNGNPSGDCTATDFCNDTPPQKGGYDNGQYGQNYGAPTAAAALHPNVCSANGDMFMNFMDYTDDAANYMFTPDQSVRIQTAMDHSPYRKDLSASSATMCGLASPVGINKNALFAANVMLSPNPSTGIVNLTTTLHTSQDLEVTIHNALGQLVLSKTYSNASVNNTTYSLNLENCSNGVYSITISNGSQTAVKRILLNR